MPRFNYSKAMRALRDERGNKCQRCGKPHSHAKFDHVNGLEFAHVITTGLNGRSRGRADRYHDIKNNPTHYELLCRPCHLAFDEKEGPRLAQEVPF